MREEEVQKMKLWFEEDGRERRKWRGRREEEKG